MASQQQPAARTWFRLPTIARPPSQPTPTPEPPTPQPRPPIIRPAFRPLGPTPPQEIGQQPSRPATNGVSSIPTSPVRRTSVPTSPTTTTSPPRPQFTAPYTASVTTSPTKPAPYTASVTTSPTKPAPYTASVTTSPTITATRREPSPPSPTRFPRTIRPSVQTPDQSPKQKPTAPPPSPLSLPPPELRSRPEHEPKIPTEAEPKGVLIQKTIEKPRPWIPGAEPRRDFEETHHRPGITHHHGKHEVPKDGETKKKTYHHKKFTSDSEEVGMRIITIAGENKGAFMEVIKSPMNGKLNTLLKNGKTKTKSDGKTGWHSFNSTSSSSGEEGKPTMKDRSLNGKAMVSPNMDAFTNSNVQGVNNSIVYNSSCTHHDPGVHLAFSRKPSGHGFHVKDNGQGHQS